MANATSALAIYVVLGAAGAAAPVAALAGGASQTPSPSSNPAAVQELQEVVVIGNAPLPGLGLPQADVPSNVQTATSKDLQREQALDLADYLNDNFSGISISESQDNPLQADVNYHGFTASPLVGTPEGLSIYVDGVRVNESFGDTVNWDLIPQAAISTVTLISGSNPVFGLNTLGGALSIQTKSGHDYPGTQVQAYGGSFGRRAFEAETGGASGAFDYFLTANDFHDDGWRDQSSTDARQVFGKFGWQTSTTDVDLSYTWADNSMFGNGAAPQSMLDFRRDAVYSVPDYTHNHLNFVNANVTQFVTGALLLSGNVYYRDLETGSKNGDVNDDNYLSDDYDGPAIDCAAPPTSLADDAYCANGINRVSQLSQRTAGVGLQLTDSGDLLGARNQAILGADFDHSRDTYDQAFQYATLTALRSASADIDPYNPLEPVNSLTGSNQILGVYITDTLSPNEFLHFTASARYNRNTETLHGVSIDTEVGDFGDGFNEANPLTGDHTFSRINPAFGFTVTPTHSLTFYANYDEASRAPTVIELGCANPEEPCGLPNAFASDPSLAQVVSRTVDAGARGQLAGQALTWSIDAFHTLNENDIEFVATTTSEGYFANVGNTKRQGLDLALGGALLQRLHWHLVYSFVDATYQSSFAVNAGSNSTADANGNIEVRPGDRIPLIPRHSGRLILDYDATPAWNIGANVVVSSGAFLHGNENNANVAGGTNGEGAYVIGSGEVSGYTVVNLDSTYHVTSALDVFLRLDNLFDRHYATAGFLTDNAFTPSGAFRTDPDDWTNENFVSPAQPRAVWVGVRLHFK